METSGVLIIYNFQEFYIGNTILNTIPKPDHLMRIEKDLKIFFRDPRIQMFRELRIYESLQVSLTNPLFLVTPDRLSFSRHVGRIPN